MARPKKNTVDYFPHPVNNGRRMFVMEQKYGDKGYCCYYKLIELLGKTENHVMDLSEHQNLIYFASMLRSSNEDTILMLSTLAELGAIDVKLWSEQRKIWCQELVDSVQDVYRNRRVDTPSNPLKHAGNGITAVVSTDNNRVSTDGNPQSKVKESKVKESKQQAFADLKIFFGFDSEIKHIQKWQQINAFLNRLIEDGTFELFTEQFEFYKKYKAAAEEKIHSFSRFIEGGWDDENWQKKYAELNIGEGAEKKITYSFHKS